MKVLWLGHNLGYPPKGGALQRNYNLIREVARKCELHVLAFDQAITRPDHISPEDCVNALARFCASVDWVPLSNSFFWRSRYGLAIKGLISGEPYDFPWLRSAEMAGKLGKIVKNVAPDVVHFDALGLAQYLPFVGEAGTVLTHHDVESRKIGVRAKKTSNPLLRGYFELEAAKLASSEQKWCPRFGVNVVVSEDEGTVLSRASPGLRVHVVPNGVDTSYFTPRPDPKGNTILFCGSMDMHPNQEAMEYFLRRIWPRIVAQCPDVKLCVVGRNPPDWLVQIGKTNPRVQITGFVDDVRPYFQKAAVCICPILSGGGTRLKILDSLAMGVPVVATSFAASGLSLEHDKQLLLADTEEQFVEYTLHLISDLSLRSRLASAGTERVNQVYSWTVVGQALTDAYDIAYKSRIRTN
jgi:polysaccharide biosynthesis protein PslH